MKKYFYPAAICLVIACGGDEELKGTWNSEFGMPVVRFEEATYTDLRDTLMPTYDYRRKDDTIFGRRFEGKERPEYIIRYLVNDTLILEWPGGRRERLIRGK